MVNRRGLPATGAGGLNTKVPLFPQVVSPGAAQRCLAERNAVVHHEAIRTNQHEADADRTVGVQLRTPIHGRCWSGPIAAIVGANQLEERALRLDSDGDHVAVGANCHRTGREPAPMCGVADFGNEEVRLHTETTAQLYRSGVRTRRLCPAVGCARQGDMERHRHPGRHRAVGHRLAWPALLTSRRVVVIGDEAGSPVHLRRQRAAPRSLHSPPRRAPYPRSTQEPHAPPRAR